MDRSQKMNFNFEDQFRWSRETWLSETDFLNWHRFFALIKTLIELKPRTVLEVGEGSAVVRRIMEPMVERYATMDVNEKLEPTYLNDVRARKPELEGKLDCVIAADVLEHIPFSDITGALKNIRAYLVPSGYALITIPHRAWFIFGMSWLWNYRPCLCRAPDWMRTAYHRIVKRQKPPKDPNHEWEIGDGEHTVQDVEEIMRKVGFTIEKRQTLLYVDFWVLKK